MALLALLYLAVIAALCAGQVKVIRKAMQQRQAGLGRFTYELSVQPLGFWTILTLEIVGLAVVIAYLFGAVGAILG